MISSKVRGNYIIIRVESSVLDVERCRGMKSFSTNDVPMLGEDTKRLEQMTKLQLAILFSGRRTKEHPL